MSPTRCSALTRAGKPCRAWAVPGSNPPLCAAHGGAAGRPGAPVGNSNAVKHGAYAVPEDPPAGMQGQIEDLDRRIERLGEYIDEHQSGWDLTQLKTALDLHSTLISRVARARQVQDRLTEGGQDEIEALINDVLDELSEEWGIEL